MILFFMLKGYLLLLSRSTLKGSLYGVFTRICIILTLTCRALSQLPHDNVTVTTPVGHDYQGKQFQETVTLYACVYTGSP